MKFNCILYMVEQVMERPKCSTEHGTEIHGEAGIVLHSSHNFTIEGCQQRLMN